MGWRRRWSEPTLRRCESLATTIRPQPAKPNLNLTPSEQAVYEIVCEDGIRIEQEHLSETVVQSLLGLDGKEGM